MVFGVAVNWVAVVVSAIVVMGIGMFWYSPSGFGIAWMKYVGLSKKDLDKAKKKGMGKTMFVALISTIVMTYILASFIGALGGSSFAEGVLVAVVIWIGFIATTALGSVLWENKSWNLWFINAGYNLVSLGLAGGILAVWT